MELSQLSDEGRDRQHEITIQGEVETRTYTAPYTARLKVAVNDPVERGQELTEGPVDPKELLAVRDVYAVQEYLLREVQKVYRMQGVEIGDKHIEVMVRQMLRKVRLSMLGIRMNSQVHYSMFISLQMQMKKHY